MMDERVFRFVEILSGIEGYADQKELADRLEVSTRTLRDIAKDAKNAVEDVGASITYRSNHGYQLEIRNSGLFFPFMEKQRKQIKALRFSCPVTSEERCEYMIRRFLTASSPLRMDDFCDMLGISRTTLAADMKLVREMLAKYDLTLETIPKKGVSIAGSEKNIQSCVADYYFYNSYAETDSFCEETLGQFCSAYENTVKECVDSVLSSDGYRMTDVGISNLIIHILITLFRTKNGRDDRMEDTVVLDKEKYRKETEMSENLTEMLVDQTGIRIRDCDIPYVAIHMIGARLFSEDDANLISMDTMNLVRNLLDEIRTRFHLDFFADIELFSLLCMHMEPMIQRVRNGIPMRNPLLQTIKSENPSGYDLAVYSAKWLSETLDAYIDENEIGFLALHFGIALQRIHETGKKRILAVCASGSGTSRMMKYSLEKIFRKNAERIETASVSELSSLPLDEYDLIVTSVPLHVSTSTRIIKVGYILSESDQEILRTAFTNSENGERTCMNAFDPDLFLECGEKVTCTEVISMMCDALGKKVILPDRFEDLTMVREKLASTYMGNRVAVPHPTSVQLQENRIVVMHLSKPVSWFGNEKAEFVFLLGMQMKEDEDSHLLIRGLYEMIQNTEILKQLKQNYSYETFISLFTSVLNGMDAESDDIFR